MNYNKCVFKGIALKEQTTCYYSIVSRDNDKSYVSGALLILQYSTAYTLVIINISTVPR